MVDNNNDCSHDNDFKEEMLDDLNDDRYDRYDRGYYYHNRKYKRKVLPMMSSIISSVTA